MKRQSTQIFYLHTIGSYLHFRRLQFIIYIYSNRIGIVLLCIKVLWQCKWCVRDIHFKSAVKCYVSYTSQLFNITDHIPALVINLHSIGLYIICFPMPIELLIINLQFFRFLHCLNNCLQIFCSMRYILKQYPLFHIVPCRYHIGQSK